MTRVKKKRSDANRIEWGDRPPRRSEKLADPDSYESRKKKALEKRKRHKSVYEKHLEQEERQQRDDERGDHRGPRGGRLAEKIRRMNREHDDLDSDADDD